MPKAQLENGYTRIASEIVDKLCVLKLSNYESRFLWALFRKTYGFNKKEDRISLSQFAKLTNIKSNHIARTKLSLLKKNIIYQKNGKIGIQTTVPNWVVPEQGVPRLVSGSTSLGVKVVPEQVHTINKINNIQKTYISIYKINDEILERIATQYNVPISFVKSKYDDMVNWHESTGKKKKDWIATLRNFVKKDAVKIRKEQNDRSKIRFINPE